ncbi:MAG: 50S ribosomal protein L3 [Phycisphaerae bacterium]|nr:50S ribosomal protein L3 [Phycisphaerae bacterium]
MTMLLGKKVGMTRVYDENGVIIPVTVIQAGPCVVTQVRTEEVDGYSAVQLGLDDVVKHSRLKKPAIGHAAKANTVPKRFVREFRVNATEYAAGDELNVGVFEDIKYVDVTGISKGKGFAGVMKRHNFKGMDASHGCERKHRHPGSIASNSGSAGKSRGIRKGKRMGGHMGDEQCTSKNHKVVEVDVENNLLLVKGPIAGCNNGYVMLKQAKTKS